MALWPGMDKRGAPVTEAIVVCDNLVKIYKVADLEVVALQGLDLEVVPGEMMAIVGASASADAGYGRGSYQNRAVKPSAEASGIEGAFLVWWRVERAA